MEQNSLPSQWRKYNEYASELVKKLGRTNNIVGEYAEYLANRKYNGTLLNISGASYDIITDTGLKYQVKSRKIDKLMSTQLNVIRSWNFDYLVVILFNQAGDILKALEIPVAVAESNGIWSRHQNGWIITTNQSLLNDPASVDITEELKVLNT